MLTVYRIQDAEGRGPWRPGFSKFWVRDRDDHDNLIPWPEQFGIQTIYGISGNIGCACRTLEGLQRWFLPEEYAALLCYGYRCVQLDADRILAESDIQVLFVRRAPLRLGAKQVSLYAKERA